MSEQKTIKHIAFIMDGNRRWAKKRSLPVIAGHKQGVESLKKITKFALDNNIEHVTVYAFSTENWKRNKKELDFLFKLLSEVALKELAELKSLGVKVDFLGDLSKFNFFDIKKNLANLKSETQQNCRLNLHIALNYGSLAEIANALNSLQEQKVSKICLEDLQNHLYLPSLPDPEILIRTGGEKRLSNFLLWQSVNSELVFTDTLWPDFSEKELSQILESYKSQDSLEPVCA